MYLSSLRVMLCLVLFLTVFGLLPHASAESAGKRFSFAVVPQHAANKVVRQWGPVLNWLSDKSGYQLEVITAKDVPEFEAQLDKSTYDFAYMSPAHFVVFNQSAGYQALAHQQDNRLRGIIVVHVDSPYQRLEDLAGERLSFPYPTAFAASVLTRAHLAKAGVAFTPMYVSSHDSVYFTVAKGIFSGGGGIIRTLKNMPPEVQSQLRVLWTSKGYTPHAVAAHSRVPLAVREAVQQAMLAMGNDPEGAVLLKALSFNKGFALANNESWDDVRSLLINDSDKITE